MKVKQLFIFHIKKKLLIFLKINICLKRKEEIMLSNEDLYDVKAGAIKASVLGLIIAGITFVVGVIDGYIRPLKCN